jgi:hypothetical protein
MMIGRPVSGIAPIKLFVHCQAVGGYKQTNAARMRDKELKRKIDQLLASKSEIIIFTGMEHLASLNELNRNLVPLGRRAKKCFF